MFIQMYNLLLAIQTAITAIGTNVSTILTNIGTVLTNLSTVNTNINTSLTNENTIKSNEATIMADTTLIKTATAVGATYSDTSPTYTSDLVYVACTLTGKYELIGIYVSASTNVNLQIDGATNRNTIYLGQGFTNLVGLNYKCNTSLKVTYNGGSCYVRYRLLP